MVAVHYATIPCEPYTAKESHTTCPCANDIVYTKFEADSGTSLRALTIVCQCTSRHLFFTKGWSFEGQEN